MKRKDSIGWLDQYDLTYINTYRMQQKSPITFLLIAHTIQTTPTKKNVEIFLDFMYKKVCGQWNLLIYFY